MSVFSPNRCSKSTAIYAKVLQGDPCCYCGRRATRANPSTRDHIQPTSKGGKRVSWQNLTAACSVCNGVKRGNKPLLSFIMGMGGLK